MTVVKLLLQFHDVDLIQGTQNKIPKRRGIDVYLTKVQNLPHPRRNFLESRVDRRVALMQGTGTLLSVVFPVSVTARHAVWSHFPV